MYMVALRAGRCGIADARRVAREIRAHAVLAELAMAEFAITNEAALMFAAGASWIDAGQPDRAVEPLSYAVQMRPDDAEWKSLLAAARARARRSQPRGVALGRCGEERRFRARLSARGARRARGATRQHLCRPAPDGHGVEFDTVIIPHLERKMPKDDKMLLNWMERPFHDDVSALLIATLNASDEDKDNLYEYIYRQKIIKIDYEADRRARVPLPPFLASILFRRWRYGEIPQIAVGDEHDVAAVAAVAAVGTALGDVLLAPEGEAAVAASPRLDRELRPVAEQGHRGYPRRRTGRRARSRH